MGTFLRKASDLQLNDTVPGMVFSVLRYTKMTGIVDQIKYTELGLEVTFRTRWDKNEKELQDYRTLTFKPDDLISVGL